MSKAREWYVTRDIGDFVTRDIGDFTGVAMWPCDGPEPAIDVRSGAWMATGKGRLRHGRKFLYIEMYKLEELTGVKVERGGRKRIRLVVEELDR